MTRPAKYIALTAAAGLFALLPGHVRAATNLFPGPDQQTPGAFGNNNPNPLAPEGLTGGPR